MNNKKIIIVLIIVLIISITLSTFLYIKNRSEIRELKEYIEKTEGINSKEEKETTDIKDEDDTEEIKQICIGPINGTYMGRYNNGNTTEEITITLKEDGTYEKNIKEGEYQKGTYQISNNNISFEYIPSGAPPDAKSSYSYKISPDCSEITIRNSDFSYTVYKN